MCILLRCLLQQGPAAKDSGAQGAGITGAYVIAESFYCFLQNRYALCTGNSVFRFEV